MQTPRYLQSLGLKLQHPKTGDPSMHFSRSYTLFMPNMHTNIGTENRSHNSLHAQLSCFSYQKSWGSYRQVGSGSLKSWSRRGSTPPSRKCVCTGGWFCTQVATTSAALARIGACSLPSSPSSVGRPPMCVRSARQQQRELSTLKEEKEMEQPERPYPCIFKSMQRGCSTRSVLQQRSRATCQVKLQYISPHASPTFAFHMHAYCLWGESILSQTQQQPC